MEQTADNTIIIDGEELSLDDIRRGIIFSEIIGKRCE